MEDLRNLSLYSKQEAMAYCRSTYSDFSCPRASYHTIHESVWHEWTNLRLWPVYDFDGCLFARVPLCVSVTAQHRGQATAQWRP